MDIVSPPGTKWYPVDSNAIVGLRTCLGRILPALSWRWHGIGLLQGYLSENSEPEVRVHIWDPSLVRTNIRYRGDIHDHRFDLASIVLVGSIEHSVFEAVPDFEGDWQTYTVVHAREDLGARYLLHSDGRVRVTEIASQVFCSGTVYTFESGRFHRSRTKELTVTLVAKWNQKDDVKARILALAGENPVHAFEGDGRHVHERQIVQRATYALLRVDQDTEAIANPIGPTDTEIPAIEPGRDSKGVVDD